MDPTISMIPKKLPDLISIYLMFECLGRTIPHSPLLKPEIIQTQDYIYFEGDGVTCIYFMKNGECGMVLPRHSNIKYIEIKSGNFFGIIDIVGSMLSAEADEFDNWITYKEKLKRQFTSQAQDTTELLNLSIEDLHKMQREFSDSYEQLFDCAYTRLNRAHKIKLLAIKFCNQNGEKLNLSDAGQENQGDMKRKATGIDQQKILAKRTLRVDADVFKPIDMNAVDQESSMFDDSSSRSYSINDIDSQGSKSGSKSSDSDVDSDELKDDVQGLEQKGAHHKKQTQILPKKERKMSIFTQLAAPVVVASSENKLEPLKEESDEDDENENLALKKYQKELIVKDDSQIRDESKLLILKMKQKAVNNLQNKTPEDKSSVLSNSLKKFGMHKQLSQEISISPLKVDNHSNEPESPNQGNDDFLDKILDALDSIQKTQAQDAQEFKEKIEGMKEDMDNVQEQVQSLKDQVFQKPKEFVEDL